MQDQSAASDTINRLVEERCKYKYEIIIYRVIISNDISFYTVRCRRSQVKTHILPIIQNAPNKPPKKKKYSFPNSITQLTEQPDIRIIASSLSTSKTRASRTNECKHWEEAQFMSLALCKSTHSRKADRLREKETHICPLTVSCPPSSHICDSEHRSGIWIPHTIYTLDQALTILFLLSTSFWNTEVSYFL